MQALHHHRWISDLHDQGHAVDSVDWCVHREAFDPQPAVAQHADEAIDCGWLVAHAYFYCVPVCLVAGPGDIT
jgi:hypothetical protein